MTQQEAENCANEIVRSILDRQDDYRKIEKAVKEQLPPGLLSDISLAGYNPFGIMVGKCDGAPSIGEASVMVVRFDNKRRHRHSRRYLLAPSVFSYWSAALLPVLPPKRVSDSPSLHRKCKIKC